MKKLSTTLLLLIGMLIMGGAHAADKKFKIEFFYPAPFNPFWENVVQVIQSACNDLNCEVHVSYTEGNQIRMVQMFEEVASGPNKPDFAFYQSRKLNAPKMLAVGEKYQVPSIIFDGGLSPKQQEKYGAPREKFKYWIGQMLPDNERAGFDLFNALMEHTMKAKGDANAEVMVAGLKGELGDAVANERQNGMFRAMKKWQNIQSSQVVTARWSREKAQLVFRGLKSRYPELETVWAGNDEMALGAVEAALAMGVTPGKDVYIGGIDWTVDALERIKQGEMVASMGGHFMDAGWVTVLAHDYFHGKDFASEKADIRSRMSKIDQNNVEFYLTTFEDKDWISKLNFTNFSKVKNPDLQEYDFSFAKLMDTLK